MLGPLAVAPQLCACAGEVRSAVPIATKLCEDILSDQDPRGVRCQVRVTCGGVTSWLIIVGVSMLSWSRLKHGHGPQKP